MSDTVSPDSNWTKEQLMGPHDAATLESMKKARPDLWGRPGYLTLEEAHTYLRFKEIVDIRGGDFKDTIYSFGEEEGEVYALCRWLRARKFVFTDVMTMVEEATACQAVPKAANYYPDPLPALGCPAAVYQKQYPQVYSGFGKNGSPLFISKTGVLNIEAVECITTVENIVKYHWYVMMHDYARRLREHKKNNASFNRFECIVILDMANLTVGQLNSRTLAIIKEQSAIDSLCFPETMNKMFIINSPRFFSATWNIIKGWIDARTANKVEVLSSRKTWEKKLLEHIDADQLPADYGGSGPNTQDTMEQEGFTGDLKRLHTEVLSIRSSDSTSFNIYPGEELNVTVYTRSLTGAKITVSDAMSKNGTIWASDIPVQHNSADTTKLPTNVEVTRTNIKGPASVKVKAESMGSRFVTSSSNYLVVFSVY